MASWQGVPARRSRLVFVGVPVIVLAMMAVAAVTAVAQRDGDFTCSASALRIAGAGPFEGQELEPVVANEAGDPCAAESNTIVDQTLGDPASGAAIVHVAHAETTRTTPGDDPAANDNVTSHAEVADATLVGSPGSLQVEAATADASVTCVPNADTGELEPQFEGDTSVVAVTITPAGDEAQVIEIPPEGEHVHIPMEGSDLVLHLNHEETDTSDPNHPRHIRRAVWLESPLGEIVAAEAIVDYTGNPCRTDEPPPGAATIVIEKNTIPDGPQDFGFSGDLGEFALDDDGSHAGGGEADPDDKPRARSFEVVPGTYAVTEGETEGFTLSDIDCSDESATTDEASRTATVTVADGDIVTCTFVNDQSPPPPGGQITIVKDANPDHEQDFSFSGDLGAFTLDDDADPALPSEANFGGLDDGTYTVTEGDLPPEWRLNRIVCQDPSDTPDDGNADNDTQTDTESRTATIRLQDGETIRCEFDNVGPVECPEGSEPNPDGECVITETECPEGSTRNEQGQCVVSETQCPEGSTRNEEGQCIATGECPEGSVRNEQGQCVVAQASCPPGSVANDQGQCVVAETQCPEGSTRNERGECIAPSTPFEPVPIDNVPGADDSVCSRRGFGRQVAIVGTSGRDRITGTNRSDRIFAFGGSDRVSGGRGNDCVEGGTGNDNLDGSNGTDYLLGGAGRDIENGGTGRDLLIGGTGHDKLTGGSGIDRIEGGRGRDRLSGGFGNDRLIGGADRDYIDAGNGSDRVLGGSGNDAINVATSGRGRDIVNCGSGRDVVRMNSDDRVRNCERVLVVRNRRR